MTHYHDPDAHGYYRCAHCIFQTPHLNRIRNHVVGKHQATLEPLPVRTWSDNFVTGERPVTLPELPMPLTKGKGPKGVGDGGN